MNSKLLPILDIPRDALASDDMSGEALFNYGSFPFRLRACMMAYCIEGTIRARINMQDHSICRGELLILLPNTFFQVVEMSEDTRCRVIALSSSFIDNSNILHHLALSSDIIASHPCVTLSSEQAEVFASSVSIIRQAEMLKPEAIRSQMICNTIHSISLMVQPLYDQPFYRRHSHASRGEDIVQQFYALVMKNYISEHRVSFYARQLKISSPYLCTIISKHTGTTALQIINRSIITDAKTQLRENKQPIKQIALSLGFDNTAFFSKFFRTQVGLTPIEFRRGLQG